MTREEALKEAQRRWGGYAWAELGSDGKCCLGAGTPPPFAAFGIGDSWDAAFADADRREKGKQL